VRRCCRCARQWRGQGRHHPHSTVAEEDPRRCCCCAHQILPNPSNRCPVFRRRSRPVGWPLGPAAAGLDARRARTHHPAASAGAAERCPDVLATPGSHRSHCRLRVRAPQSPRRHPSNRAGRRRPQLHSCRAAAAPPLPRGPYPAPILAMTTRRHRPRLPQQQAAAPRTRRAGALPPPSPCLVAGTPGAGVVTSGRKEKSRFLAHDKARDLLGTIETQGTRGWC
jgi:hypothetical protein